MIYVNQQRAEEITASTKRAREMIMERIQRLRDAKEWSDSRALATEPPARNRGAEAEEADGDSEPDVTAADAAR